MGKNIFISALFLVVTFALNLSCEEKTTKSDLRTHFDAIKEIINENPDIFLVDVFDTSVNPVFFREITSRDFDLENASIEEPDPGHDFRYVEPDWVDSIKGVLHYFIDGEEYTKPIHAYSKMVAYFEQWGEIYDPHWGWLLKKISGNVIASVPSHVMPPVVHITSEEVDTFFSETAVLNLVKKDSVLHFAPGKEVTFTVESDLVSDFFLFLHIGEDGNFRKISFVDNGDGTSSASWTTTNDPKIAEGYKHAFVDAISRDAVTDTTAEYNSKTWGIIYRIK